MKTSVRDTLVKKILAWGFWAANLAVIAGFWFVNAIPELISGDTMLALYACARLFGLLATFCALTQFLLMGRVGWLEPIFGLDRLAVFHRRNGVATLVFILLHSSLMSLSHPALQGTFDIFKVVELPYVWLALTAELLFIITVGTSVYIVRKHLRFETWYAVHLFSYAAIALVPWHQLTNGSDLLAHQLFEWYWIGLYAFTALNIAIWRFGMPFGRFAYHRFTVQKVQRVTPTATSVYITGNRMDNFKARGGQFVLVRFLTCGLWWQEHPFSLSRLPNDKGIRLTVRQLGDFTNKIPALKPGTPVVVSGPYGAFTHRLRRRKKVLYIAGGIGITPIRSMIQEQAERGETGNAILLYGNRTLLETAFADELAGLGAAIGMPIYNVLSEQPDYEGEKGIIDRQKIAKLVPDVAERDVFLCGPPPMMVGIKQALATLGVPKNQINYERFSLHKQ